MPNEHLSADQLRAYRDRTFPSGELLAASNHLAQCSHCRTMLSRSLGNEAPTLRGDVAAVGASPKAAESAGAADVRDFDVEALAEQAGTRALQRWLLPLAAAVAIGVGGFWWTITLRQQNGAAVKLTDSGKDLQIGVDGRARALRDLPAPLQAALAEALRTGRLEIPPDVLALNGGTGAPPSRREPGPIFRVLSPVATAVAEDKPRFRWASQLNADAYRVNVVAENTGASISSNDLPPTQTDWMPNESLPTGEIYKWEVQALRDGKVVATSPAPPQAESRFRVLSPAQRAEFDQLKVAAKGSHLSLGVAAARAGLLDDAAAELRELAVENPRSEIVRQLLEQLDSKRRQ